MDLHLNGKRALVVGGTRGIGRAVAVALAQEGAVVAVAARRDVHTVAAELAAESGGRVIGFTVDSRDDGSVHHLVKSVVAELGGVDILVNTAATPWTAEKNQRASQTSDDAMREEFETKVLGYLRTARAVAPHMVAQGWGRIINVSGLGARSAGSVALTFRNVSVSAITKNLADELGPSGVNVVVVHPGATRTEAMVERLTKRATDEGTTLELEEEKLVRNSIGRLIDSTEVADVIAFLASPRSVSINGDAIAVGGGVPGVVVY